MGIKVEVNTPEGVNRDYPYVGSATGGKTVFFTAPKTGVVLTCPHDRVGYYARLWVEGDFTPLPKGATITIKQE